MLSCGKCGLEHEKEAVPNSVGILESVEGVRFVSLLDLFVDCFSR